MNLDTFNNLVSNKVNNSILIVFRLLSSIKQNKVEAKYFTVLFFLSVIQNERNKYFNETVLYVMHVFSLKSKYLSVD